jgi:flagellin
MSELFRIRTNMGAEQAYQALQLINRRLAQSQLRLSTGFRINKVEDDPAGYTMGKTLEGRIRGLKVAQNNVADAKNVLGIAEGGLTNIHEILLTMKEKVTQAANDTLGSSERTAIETELDELINEIDDIVSQTEFNGNALIDGTYTSKVFMVGEGTGDTFSFGISQDHDATALGVADSDIDVSTAALATASLASINSAIDTVTSTLQTVGSTISRFDVKEATLSLAITNTEAAHSRIFDTDFAQEQVEATKMQILQQSASVMLLQSNLAPQVVLQLFGG